MVQTGGIASGLAARAARRVTPCAGATHGLELLPEPLRTPHGRRDDIWASGADRSRPEQRVNPMLQSTAKCPRSPRSRFAHPVLASAPAMTQRTGQAAL